MLLCTNLSKCNSVIITILLHLSCLTVDSTAHLDSMFPTHLREERGGETDWKTPHPRPGQPREHHQRLHQQKSLTPRTRLEPRTLSGSSFCSYPLSWWSRPHLISTTPTTSRSCLRAFMLSKCSDLSSSSCCKKFHVDRVFILVYNAFIHDDGMFLQLCCSCLLFV